MSATLTPLPDQPTAFAPRDLLSVHLLSDHPGLTLAQLLALPGPTEPNPLSEGPESLPEPVSVPTARLLSNLNLLTAERLHDENHDENEGRLTPGSRPDVPKPSLAELLMAFNVPNKEGLTVGGRALTKHAFRDSQFWGPASGSEF
ncbi:hypothetical protein P7C70_g8263, partial [Phenoliferia sp. Uapishka_3]